MFGSDFKFGDFLTLDYGFGHITPFWNFGFTGYTRWQIQSNSGADAGPPPEHRLFTTAVGGEFGYFFLKARLDVALRVLTDVSSISAPKGTTIALNFIWLPCPRREMRAALAPRAAGPPGGSREQYQESGVRGRGGPRALAHRRACR